MSDYGQPALRDNAIDVLIADDHVLFRQGLRRILESVEWITVVGEASDGNDAVKTAREINPDIILMDVSMPHLNGLEATQRIKRILPDTRIILLTMHEDNFLQEDGKKIGASGYLSKRTVDRELFDAIDVVSSGGKYFCGLSQISTETRSLPAGSAISYESLSAREKEILRLLAGGMTNKDISESLCISINTVETHRKNIMKKLNLHNLSDIIKYTMVQGLLRKA
ncbi:MAG: response regulator transcription factor [Nitrospirae bacterium]|nr:response regulator transcription factor [Nitrospirota bacterium]